ncbi:hypothetical protein [Ulvibacterium marinum]|uniref:hypothetical protein n=1 Tax=Ulvibacterium marinum TaxID=2419782 RepID=UPI001B870ABC|nr:hypothetical protein [Ulvibacterium marinum]
MAHSAFTQQIAKEELIFLTPEWEGEDGRPYASDAILQRMKQVTPKEAWAVLKEDDF